MSITSSEFEYLVEGIVKDITILLMNEYDIEALKALDIVYIIISIYISNYSLLIIAILINIFL